METKVINVSIGRTIEATQYDAGQVLVFDGIDIPDGSEAHFSNQKVNEKTVINNNQCDIPDNILQISGKGMLSIYVINEDSSRTVYDFLILIKKRAELPDGIAPEHQQSFEEKIVEMFNETKAIAESIEQRANDGEFNGRDGIQGKDGVSGKTPQKGIDYLTDEEINTFKVETKTYIDGQITERVDKVKSDYIEELIGDYVGGGDND